MSICRMHICVTFNTVKANGDVTFIRDLKDVVDELMNEPDKGSSSEMVCFQMLLSFFAYILACWLSVVKAC